VVVVVVTVFVFVFVFVFVDVDVFVVDDVTVLLVVDVVVVVDVVGVVTVVLLTVVEVTVLVFEDPPAVAIRMIAKTTATATATPVAIISWRRSGPPPDGCCVEEACPAGCWPAFASGTRRVGSSPGGGLP
jgi:hypothetical protein